MMVRGWPREAVGETERDDGSGVTGRADNSGKSDGFEADADEVGPGSWYAVWGPGATEARAS
jgi:hypothetical protein